MSTALADLRNAVATAIAGTDPMPEDATVLPDVVDAVSPPAYMTVWGTPWLLPSTYCAHAVRLDVVCIAGRMDPAPGIETLETMVAVALNRLRAARLPEATVLPPGPFEIGGVRYLAARLSIETQITIPEPIPPSRSSGSATLTATATLIVTGSTSAFATRTGAAVLVAAATLTVTGTTAGTSTGAATLSAAGTLTATGQTIAVPKTGAAALTAAGTVTATGSTSAGFSPASLPNLIGWWDASDLASITASAGAVSQWNDKSGAGRHLTMATGANQPATGTATVHGKNALSFDASGSPDTLRRLAVSVAQPFTVVTRIKWASGTIMYTLGNDGPLLEAAGNWKIYAAGAMVDTTRACDTTIHTHRVVFNGATSKFYEDSTQYGGTMSPGTKAVTDLYLAASDTGVSAITGLVCEWVIVSGVMSDPDAASLESYLAAKW